MGLIYVNPEGPNGNADPAKAAIDIRETFRRMAMNDEETVALIAGGHTFGKAHGAGDPDLVGPEPEGCPVHGMGLGWINAHGTGKGTDTTTSGLEGAWNPTPTEWNNDFWDTLFGYEWELGHSPAGAQQWHPKGGAGADTVPDAQDPNVRHAPMMATTDLALLTGPGVPEDLGAVPRQPRRVRRRLRPGLVQAAAPRHGSGVPLPRPVGARAAAVAGPGAGRRGRADRRRRHRVAQADDPRLGPVGLRPRLHGVGVGVQLPRHRQARRRQRRPDPPGSPEGLGGQRAEPHQRACCRSSRGIQSSFGKNVSLADLIVLGGCAAVEKAAKDAGHDVTVPFRPGRTDATQEQTDVESFEVLEPKSDGFRNHLEAGDKLPPEQRLLDRANLLSLCAPEMTVLVGGLRVLGANTGGSPHGVFTDKVGTLTNDFFVNLLASRDWTTSKSAGERVRERRPHRHRRRPRLRLELAAPGAGRGLRLRRRQGEVRPRLRGGVGQGHGARPLRPPLAVDRVPALPGRSATR